MPLWRSQEPNLEGLSKSFCNLGLLEEMGLATSSQMSPNDLMATSPAGDSVDLGKSGSSWIHGQAVIWRTPADADAVISHSHSRLWKAEDEPLQHKSAMEVYTDLSLPTLTGRPKPLLNLLNNEICVATSMPDPTHFITVPKHMKAWILLIPWL